MPDDRFADHLTFPLGRDRTVDGGAEGVAGGALCGDLITIALAVEGLVATFKAMHEDLSHLPYAASILVSVAILLAGWGLFIQLNRAAEELEPEAMAEAKSEDKKLE